MNDKRRERNIHPRIKLYLEHFKKSQCSERETERETERDRETETERQTDRQTD